MTMIANEIHNLADLIKNCCNEDKSWSLFHESIMSNYMNLHSNLIKALGEDSSIYEENIDIYNNDVFSITYKNKYYIIIPDMESYGNDNDKKLIIVMKYDSLDNYKKAIKWYYSRLGIKYYNNLEIFL
jgi:hypothetical protein